LNFDKLGILTNFEFWQILNFDKLGSLTNFEILQILNFEFGTIRGFDETSAPEVLHKTRGFIMEADQ
jgi:hypothetical protein